MMRPWMGVAVAVLSACATSGSDPSLEQALAGTAAISLKSSSARITQTSDTEWSLDKTGTVDASGSTVIWTVTATKGPTVAGRLVVNGTMTVRNHGSGGATIGNIVVNLQTRSGPTWVTRSSDIADATQDDAATIAHIVPTASSEDRSVFTENAASGHLLFMDATTNTVFSLVPQVTIPPHSTVTLLFTASYDNNVLHLAAGTTVRIESIISFGNAQPNGLSGANIDINGNGVIDSDEVRVRSVPSRLRLTVPDSVPGNTTVTLSDTLQDITTTGTVTFDNATFNLGATGGTVTVHYNGGTSGGTLTNCAHLTGTDQTVATGGFLFPSITGIDLTACNTQTIGPHTCSPGVPGCGWEDGDLITYSQNSWGDTPTSTNAAGLLQGNFDAVYPVGLEVGIAGAAGFSMRFFDSLSLLIYLPAGGPPAPLNADLINPASSSSGIFGGAVVALQLNVDFSDRGLLAGTASVHFGDLLVCGTAVANGTTVREVLALANTALGGGTTPYTLDMLDTLALDLSAAFEGGTASTFAQDHLFVGACP